MKQQVITYVFSDGMLDDFLKDLIENNHIINQVIPIKYEKTMSGDYFIIKAVIIVTKQE